MNLIAAVDKNMCIGKDNALLFHIKRDMKFFRETTIGKTVIMGHSTLKSFPDSKPLPKRTNIVLSRDKNLKIDGAIVCSSVQEVMSKIADTDKKDVFVIGGEQIYSLFMPYCSTAYITIVDAEADGNKFLKDFTDEWHLFQKSEIIEDDGYLFTFNIYKKFYK